MTQEKLLPVRELCRQYERFHRRFRWNLFAVNSLKIPVMRHLVKMHKIQIRENSQFQHTQFCILILQKFIGKQSSIPYNKRGCCQNGKRFAFRRNGNILRTSSIIGGDTNGKFNENIKKATASTKGTSCFFRTIN